MLRFILNVTCYEQGEEMATPAKERMAKMRQKRQGRTLTLWLYPKTERTLWQELGSGGNLFQEFLLAGPVDPVPWRGPKTPRQGPNQETLPRLN
jgi:hypothetical protein